MQTVKKFPGLEDMQGSGSRSNSCVVTHKSEGRKGARFRRTLFQSSQQIEGTWNGRKIDLRVGPPVALGSRFTTKRRRASSTPRPSWSTLFLGDPDLGSSDPLLEEAERFPKRAQKLISIESPIFLWVPRFLLLGNRIKK